VVVGISTAEGVAYDMKGGYAICAVVVVVAGGEDNKRVEEEGRTADDVYVGAPNIGCCSTACRLIEITCDGYVDEKMDWNGNGGRNDDAYGNGGGGATYDANG
jgi:hypothetical protein